MSFKVKKAGREIFQPFLKSRERFLPAFYLPNRRQKVFSKRFDKMYRIVLSPGEYQYKFVVDGEWIIEPENQNTARDNAGNANSLLVIKP